MILAGLNNNGISMARDASVRWWKSNVGVSVQKYLPFGEIRNGFVLLKNWGIRGILRCGSINFHLKSEDEQKSIISGYQGFLNTLSFPIQILVRSKRLNIDNYVESIEATAEQHSNPLLKEQTLRYVDFVKKLVEFANIMEKQFYVVVPYEGISNEKRGFFDFIRDVFGQWEDSPSAVRSRLKNFEKMKMKLKQRIDLVANGLGSVGIKSELLNTADAVEVLYQMYNPEISKQEKIQDLNWYDFSFKQ